MSKMKKGFFAFGLLVLIAAMSLVLVKTAIVRADTEAYEGLRVFTEVLSVVKKNYVEPVESKTLVYGAIRGMLSSLDPHSSFMTTDDYKEMQVETKGEFGGLGIQIGIKDGSLTVISPIEDTPAWKAGIKAGDKIVKINGETTKNLSLQDAVGKMRGPKGTPVTISVYREGWTESKDFTITRDIIRMKSIKSRVIDGNIGYVKITQFQEATARDLAEALKKLQEAKVTALVLDMRNNPGGLLQSAIEVSEQFLPKGKLVVYLKSRNGDRVDYNTSGSKDIMSIPMVVLVNQGSASASEIVAGALKDWKRAVIIGVQTFGKGSVQSIIPLSDGAALRLTTSRYYTPQGISIQSTGITPDIVVRIEAKNGEKEHPVMREKDLERHLVNDKSPEPLPQTSEPEKAIMADVDEKDDAQLQRGVDLLKTWQIFRQSSITMSSK